MTNATWERHWCWERVPQVGQIQSGSALHQRNQKCGGAENEQGGCMCWGGMEGPGRDRVCDSDLD